MSGRTDNVELEIYYRRRGYRKRIFYLERYISILTSILGDPPIQIYGSSWPTIDIDIKSKGLESDILKLVVFPEDREWRLYFVASKYSKADRIACGKIGNYTHFEETLKTLATSFLGFSDMKPLYM